MKTLTNTWQLQTAKNKFSEMVNLALGGEPQLVTRNGKPAVYVVAAEVYEKEKKRGKKNIKSLLLNSPCKDVKIQIIRDKSDTGRSMAF